MPHSCAAFNCTNRFTVQTRSHGITFHSFQLCAAAVLALMAAPGYEDLTAFLGDRGPFQLTVFLLLSLSIVPNGYTGMAMVFLADTPDFRCRSANASHAGVKIGARDTGSGCEQRVNGSSEPCVSGWEYSSARYRSTVVTEWDLVCGDAWKVPFTLSIFFVGVLSGSFISGELSDRFGRKTVLFATMATQLVCSLLQVASVNWEMFAVFFCLTGFGQNSNYMAAFVLGSELLGKNLRVAFSVLGVCVFYALGYALLPLFAYYLRSWRILLTALSLPALLYIPLWWFIPESPRWLLSKGRVKEAEDIIRKAAKKNGVTPPEVIFKDSELIVAESKNSDASYTYMDLIRTPKIRSLTLLNSVVWFTITISYFGLCLSTPNMSGDPYLNCLFSALTEVVASILTWLSLKVVPRRALIAGPLLSSGLVLLLVPAVPPDYGSVTVALAMVGKLGVTAAFAVLYISTAEQFPTVVRGMGMGVCSMCSKIGSTISPFFPYFGHYNQVLPYILMGLLTLIAGVLSILMPETRGIPLPETLSQVQSLNWCCGWCRNHRRTDKTPEGLVTKL
ncbi:solute carrier family 22 member 4 isoform X3 [Neoarius graeffei]|uniref:solute carrier family 22 member 4 isoform X3 n=1 Tax=Neoarius graeffei TaxID=443677 RepID=UPI00298CD06F|nr:solute carrier family 22 member 4 isoform X3 [Neoarius graeffei]